jgi:hemolysin activation/secretion protein
MEIPPVIDRPFETDEGPRIAVRQFRLVDARDLPRFDIEVADVQALLDAKLAEKQEYTIGQLQEVADAVTTFYREKGLILAQAVVPVQTVQAGVVDIQIYEGRLGRVLAEGNSMYSEELLRGPFAGLIGEPVTKDEIETALLTLSTYPGLTVFGVFQPGQQVGEADLVVRVQEEKRFDVSFRVDNHGLQDTGRARFRPVVEWNNITGTADRVMFTVQQTYRPKNNIYWAIDYDRYLPWGFHGGVSASRNRFDVGGEFAAQKIQGETRLYSVWLERDWIRSRQMNLTSRLTYEHKYSETTTRDAFTNQDRLSVFSLEVTADQVDTRFKGINYGTIGYYRGVNDLFGAMGSSLEVSRRAAGTRSSRQGGSGRFAAGQFDRLFLTASRLQTIRPTTSLLLRTEYQWSDDLLVPMEQYSIGGPDNVRAFPPAQALVDEALFLSVELIQNLPFIGDKPAFGNRTWGELVQISAFYDHAIGVLNDPLPSDPQGHENYKGAGVQARFTMPGFIEARLQFAWEVGSDEAENERSPQIWGDFTYRF